MNALKAILPPILRRQLRVLRRWIRLNRPRRVISLGDLARVTPISREWGYDRGTPIDRYYIETFLAKHSPDIRGRVLEIAEDVYTKRFGATKVTRSDILHAKEGNSIATIVADLTDAPDIPSDTFDCVILTETLQLIYDVRAALATVRRILKPGGIVLATVPGITQFDGDGWEWCWCFTAYSTKRLFEEVFSPSRISVEAYGNVNLAVAFLHGLCAEEVNTGAFQYNDPFYQLVITVRAVKSYGAYEDS